MICRDVQFWDSVATHEAVAPHIFMGTEAVTLAPIIEREDALPMRSENGGIIFVPVDPFRLVYEMHTLYTPEGWGREVAKQSKLFILKAFEKASLILTHEQEGYWKSQPPKSHGWKCSGDFCYVGYEKRIRLWLLTRDAFLASPVGRKLCQ
jgi:hypothetical protein